MTNQSFRGAVQDYNPSQTAKAPVIRSPDHPSVANDEKWVQFEFPTAEKIYYYSVMLSPVQESFPSNLGSLATRIAATEQQRRSPPWGARREARCRFGPCPNTNPKST